MPKKGGITLKAGHIISRKSIDTEKDSYLSKNAPKELSLCRRCGAVYHGKRWYQRRELPHEVAEKHNSGLVYCPGCQKVRDMYPEGFLLIEGKFVEAHAEEIMNLIGNKETIQSRTNPLEQVMEVKRFDDRIEVKTTTEKLAQKIGQVIKKSYSGKITYKWSDDIKIARVIWRRDGE